ncbi:hypothetical protein [Kitasatospora sp. GP82]|uniref:hypothetical protein n=1 Tax=Kitasatospora sp. GP82 TaxID=3035089 RepID=UPI002474A48D|nr:hypothetical protein [Kitasatospora sp. GP82]MDH6128265.1 hypothetical protein [Kitasatospora sp. GP82]
MRDKFPAGSRCPGEAGAAAVPEMVGHPAVEAAAALPAAVEASDAAVSGVPGRLGEEGSDACGRTRAEAPEVPCQADGLDNQVRVPWVPGRPASARTFYERAPVVALAVVLSVSVAGTWVVGRYFLEAADLGVPALLLAVVAVAALVLPLGVAAHFARRLRSDPKAAGPMLLGTSTALLIGSLDYVVLLARFLSSLTGAP